MRMGRRSGRPPLITEERRPERGAIQSGKTRKNLQMVPSVSAEDGKQLSQTELDGEPAFDGMAAADNKEFISLRNGKLVCFQ